MKHIQSPLYKIIITFIFIFMMHTFSSGIVYLDSDEDLWILEVRTERNIILDGIDVYRTESSLLLPIVSVLQSMGFYVKEEFSVNAGFVTGWVYSPKNTFKISLYKKVAIIGKKVFKFTDEEVQMKEYVIYIEKEFFEKLFPSLQVESDFNNLIMFIKSETPLPIEIQYERERVRARIVRYRRSKEKKEIANLNVSSNLFSFPSFNLYTSYAYRDSLKGDKKAYYTSEGYSLSSDFIFAGFDSNLTMYTSSFGQLDFAHLMMRQYSPDKNLLGFASELTMGDVSMQSEPLISKAAYGSGFSISSFDRNAQNKNNNIQITGELQHEWEVELIRNGVLIDFFVKPVDGRYIFKNVEIFSGLNVFLLRFYGPHGQIKEEEKQIYIDRGFKAKGAVDFRLAFINKSHSILKDSSSIPNDFQYIFDLETGITSLFTLTGGFVYNKPLTKRKEGRSQYARIGGKTSFGGMLFNFNAAVNNKDSGHGSSTSVESRILSGWHVFAEHKWFNNFVSDYSTVYGMEVRNVSKVVLDKPMMIFPFKKLPINFSLEKTVAQDNTSYIERAIRVSPNFFRKYKISITGNDRVSYSDITQRDLQFLFSTRYRTLNIKSNMAYLFRPTEKMLSHSISANFGFLEKLNFSIGWSKNFLDKGQTLDSYSTGISSKLPYGSVGVSTNYDSNKKYGVYLSYSLNLDYDYQNNKLGVMDKNYKNKGTVVVRVFLDNNNDGIFNNDDLLLEDVKFKSDQVRIIEKTDENGIAILHGIPTYRVVSLKVDLNSLEDVYWISNKEEEFVYLKPGAKIQMDFPIIMTGDIEGILYLEDKVLRGFPLLLLDKHGNFIKKVYSEIDGLFLFEQVPVGEYFLALDKTNFRGYSFSKERIIDKVSVEVPVSDPVVLLDDVILTRIEKEV
ncbi:MAG: hypothetical protein GY817_02135 [bacterium]|nr:hypothetical protein [bacterium]